MNHHKKPKLRTLMAHAIEDLEELSNRLEDDGDNEESKRLAHVADHLRLGLTRRLAEKLKFSLEFEGEKK